MKEGKAKPFFEGVEAKSNQIQIGNWERSQSNMATTKKKVPFVPKQEIYTYDAPWTCYGLAWSNNKAEPYRLAVGSFVEEYVEIEREARTISPHSHSNTGTAIKYRS